MTAGTLRIVLDREALASKLYLCAEDIDANLVEFTAPSTRRRRGVEMKIVAGERQPMPDQAMIRALRNAHRWADMLKSGTALKDIAEREGFSESYVGRIIPLATLSPKIQEAIVTGVAAARTHTRDLHPGPNADSTGPIRNGSSGLAS